MFLFALCLFPLLRSLEDKLPSMKIGRQAQHGPVIAYADDLTVFVTDPEAFITIQQAVRAYERATGARLNPRKSKALAVGAWTEPPTSLGIAFHDRIDILGVEFGPTVALSMQDSWSSVTRAMRAQARRAYAGHLCLVQRMHYVQLCLFAKIWHVAQIFPLLRAQAQQLMTLCTWFLW